MAETVIRTYPQQFNAYRDIAKTYDVAEGYAILRRAKLVYAEYQLYEELVSPYHAFTKKGRQALTDGVSKLSQDKAPLKIAIYTCGGYIFLIGCHCEQLFLVDTHPIGADLGGNGNGILKVYPANESELIHQLCVWIWKRLQISGVQAESMQSLMNITEVSRYDFVYLRRDNLSSRNNDKNDNENN